MTTPIQPYNGQPEPDFVPPTIADARLGWGLTPTELTRLLNAHPDWAEREPLSYADGEHTIMYEHRTHGYCQCWDFALSGEMYQVRLLILPDAPHLVGAFLLGSSVFGDSWVYVKEMIAHPEAAPQLFMHEFERMTVLQVRFHRSGQYPAAA
jgi:hypothetical protein